MSGLDGGDYLLDERKLPRVEQNPSQPLKALVHAVNATLLLGLRGIIL